MKAVAVALLVAAVAACGQSASSFSPTGPCTVDGRAAASYLELEALVPRDIAGEPADTIDSGRNCSDRALGTLRTRGITEVRFAGATWDQGDGDGTVVAVFETPAGQPPLEASWIEEFYQAGAVTSSKTDNTRVTRPSIGAAGTVYRLDTLNDLSQQTVVVLPGTPQVRVVIVATRVDPNASRADHDARVEAAVAAAVSPGPDGS
jgi:hypothetical protein